MAPEKIQCQRCTMTFRVEVPPGVIYRDGQAQMQCESSRCADCKRPFWHAEQPSQKVRTGILPIWLPEWRA